ncbi:MAG TPA: tRNA (adenosine(37)-N6)-threonylcarbamoyltransferase complex ATPase subunit type 1 TsaE [Firmicutes bacterium]|nr:MAG: tRNA (adenosine(37)-N6)-threonylcarbamoyltransferase complex ATPase subunit type 1 TsaE [Candidatus Coatesbacteria bacterium]RLC43584.1 MAG: tRNA (adenosine(37)-N6)-threonylcarbamoyltransferase complex ATPase subunit type 1 TsaE [Candidatus Coatesbacteria bacterium]HDM43410.1 tRNA (adenosine(37)-N6)-threonylcarbamoyltransferase complex ATPase subunit type 1 TsaE [Bacillota bacterium]HEC80568.1 tRNA (adenosine(37)-N6)-threonylcarbamoyltransferase complex ATPase subunit type 1 TsaE [Bacill
MTNIDDYIGREIETGSENETKALGREIVGMLGEGSVVALVGELGAGKTVFIKGMAEGLGIKDLVSSPSFIIVNFYLGRLPLAHLDLYRLSEIDAISDGIYEYLLEDGITAVEWADRAPSIIPDEAIKIEIEVKGVNKRLIRISIW